MVSVLEKRWQPTLMRAEALIALIVFMSHVQAASPLRIGLIGPFSGPSADFGIPMQNGAQLAIDEINAAGGYMGRPFQLVIRDDMANPEEGRKQAALLLNDKVVVAIGFCNTGVALSTLDLFQRARTPLLIPCATGTPLTSKFDAAESYIFRTSARDSIQAPFVVSDILKRGWKRIAIFADNTAYGESGLKDVLSALAQQQISPVYISRFKIGVTDLSADLRAAREAGANVLFSYTVGPENAVIAKGRSTLRWAVPQVGGWPLSFPFFIAGAGNAAEGALMAQTFIAEPNNERRAAFLASYGKRFGSLRGSVPMAAAQAYDTVYILLHALFNAKVSDLDGPALKKALENIHRAYYGVLTTYEMPFSATNKDAITENMLVMGQVKNGVVTFAYAADAKRSLFIQRKR